MSVLDPIHVEDHPRSDASDPKVVKEINDIVVARMQREVDRLVKGRIPVIGKIGRSDRGAIPEETSGNLLQ